MSEQNKKDSFYAIAVVLILITVAITGAVILLSWQDEESLPSAALPVENTGKADLFFDKAYPKTAIGYSVEYHDTYKVLHLHDPWNQTYILVQHGEEVPSGYLDAQVFFIPIERVVTLSTTQLPMIMALNESASIKGHEGLKLAHGEEIKKLAGKGEIIEVGQDLELIVTLEPDVVFCDANDNSISEKYKYIEVGLNPVIEAEWMEEDPLGRAEWIKYYSLFYNKEKTANEVYARIKNNYTTIREKTAKVAYRPTVLNGITWHGSWCADGGGSYMAQLFQDAGGDYIWADTPDRDNLWFDFEYVYDQGHDAEFWIDTGTAESSDELLALDPRYEKFEAFGAGRVYGHNARVNEFGGNDFWQSGVIHPDIVLADLVKILHPELLPDHELYYYQQIVSNQSGSDDGS